MLDKLKNVDWTIVGLYAMLVLVSVFGAAGIGISLLFELGILEYKQDTYERRYKSHSQVCASKVVEVETPAVDNGFTTTHGRLILEYGVPTRLEYDGTYKGILAHERVHIYQMCTDGISIDKLSSLDELHPRTNVYFLKSFITPREIMLEHEAFHVMDECAEEYNRQYELWVDAYVSDEELGQYIRACVQQSMSK